MRFTLRLVIALCLLAAPAAHCRHAVSRRRSVRSAASAAPSWTSRFRAPGWAMPRRSSTTSRDHHASRSRRSTTTTSPPRSRSRPTARSACTTCGCGRRPESASCGPSASALLKEINEVEPNNDFAAPQAIPMNVTVTGIADNEDVDYFVVEAKKGERISAEVEGLRLGISEFDPYVAILNSKRFELGVSDDAALALARWVHLDHRARGRQVHHPGARKRLRRQRRLHLPPARRQFPAGHGDRARRRQAGRDRQRALDRRPGRRDHLDDQAARRPSSATSASSGRTTRASRPIPTRSA